MLSGGASSRMGRPKALLTLEGETFLGRLCRLFAEAGCGSIAVVVGAHAAEIAPHVPAGVTPVIAEGWTRGMRASLAAGLRSLPPGPVLLTHVDRPIVRSATLAALWSAAQAAPERPIVAHHDDRPGHPVVLPAALRPRLIEPDDRPLRDLLQAASPVAVAVDDPGVLLNINTPADYQRIVAAAACI